LSLIKDVQKHVKSQCATYAGRGCCHLDRPCSYFLEYEGACSYFESSVLPGNEALKVRYFNSVSGDADSIANTCERCNDPFEKRSNSQRFCAECQAENEREKRRKRDREYRARKRRNQAE
jgi:hypothetical protein